MPPDPTNGANYFTGWNTLAAPSTQSPGTWFNSASQVNGNIEVFAQWNSKETKLAAFYDNYDGSGGSIIARVYSNGQSNNFNGTLPVIDRSGYVFGGWYLNDQTCSGAPAAEISTQGNYYAKWTLANYTVRFLENAGGDTVNGMPADKSITSGIFETIPPEPTRNDYAFIEWNRNNDGTGEAMYPSTVISASTSVSAIWQSSKNVIFDGNGGKTIDNNNNEVNTQTILAIDGVLQIKPQPPEQSGFTFLGWGTSSGATTTVDISDVSAYNTLYAVWSPIYQVIFDAHDGDWGGTPATTQTAVSTAYGSVLYIPVSPTRLGYDFSYWCLQSDGTGGSFTMTTEITGNNTMVYAIWTPVASGSKTVTYQSNGGSSVAAQTTTQIDTAPSPTKTGYILENWYNDPNLDGANKVTFPYVVTTDITLYAAWTPNGNTGYTVEHYVMDEAGAYPSSPTATDNNTGTTDATLTLSSLVKGSLVVVGGIGYSSGTVDGNTVTESAIAADGTRVVKLYYERSQYTLTLSAGTGTSNVSGAGVYYYGQTIQLSVDVDNGYLWSQWTSNSTSVLGHQNTQNGMITMPVGSLTLMANATAISPTGYTVTLNDNGGSGGSGTVIASYGSAMPTATKPVRSGYNFLGYYDATSGGNQYYNSSMTSVRNWDYNQNKTLYASWYGADVSGNVIDDATPVQVVTGASIKIMLGNTQYGNTAITAADGSFTIYNVPAGTYNLIMTLGDKTEIIVITISGNTLVANVGTILFPLGNASSALKLQGTSTPAIVIGNLHPEAENYLTSEGGIGFVKVEMTVEETSANITTNAAVLTAINQMSSNAQASGETIGIFLDMNIERYQRALDTAPWSYTGKIDKTSGLIQIVIPIPGSLQGKSNYIVYRYHNNVVNQITSVPNIDLEYLTWNAEKTILTMYVKKFSVYAISYPNTVSASSSSGSSSKTTVATTAAIVSEQAITVTGVPQLDKVNHMVYMQGYTDDSFRASRDMTRAEVIVMFSRLLTQKMDIEQTYSTSFYDVKGTEWYANAIGFMEQFGLIKGYDGTFRPNESITRAEFAVIASRFDSMETSVSSGFEDVSDGYWASKEIALAVAKGWIKGYPDGTFRPDSNITRAEVVTLVNRMLERKGDTVYLQAESISIQQYTDLNSSNWAYQDIMEASHDHQYEKEDTVETWTEAN